MQSLHSAITTPPALETTAERGQDVPPLATPRFLLLTRRVNQKPARRTPSSATRSPAEPAPCFLAYDRLPAPTPPLARSPPTSQLSNFPTNRQADKLASWQAPAVQRGGPERNVVSSSHPLKYPAPAEPTPAPSTRAGCLLSLLPRGTRARSPPPHHPAAEHHHPITRLNAPTPFLSLTRG